MKKLKKSIGFFLFVGILLLLSPAVTSKAAALDPKIGLEISNNSTFDVQAPIRIRGWGLNTSGIKAIDIWVDGSWKKSLVKGDGFGYSRPDVKQAYPAYPDADTSGYDYNLKDLSVGTHTLTVWAIGNDGTKTSSTVSITVSSSPKINLELSDNETVPLNQPILLRGWALNSGVSGVDTVDIWVSNGSSSWFNHSLTVNLSRPDVAQLYPNYYNNVNCGYSEYMTFSTPGTYTIYAYAMKGSTKLASTSVTLNVIDPNNHKGQDVVNYAKKFLGVPYVWGGTSSNGFDCSGFVQYVYAHFNVSLPRTSEEQVNLGTPVSKSDLEPGDLVFFNNTYNGVNPTHVGIYVGNGQFIAAGSAGVSYSDLNSNYWTQHYATARRIFN
ncbi:C40 family peptidase [Clostridium neuense]|uniref:C40 family peptidase n=1 Tax=Clostridium neuense TaxID=1728934 RepID=A0ABW8TDN8_9CLOT